MAYGSPSAGIVAESVQQIEHRIWLLRRWIVSGRRVDVIIAVVSGNRRLVKVMMNLAVRHICYFPRGSRRGDVYRIGRGQEIGHEQVVEGIERARAVHENRVSVV